MDEVTKPRGRPRKNPEEVSPEEIMPGMAAQINRAKADPKPHLAITDTWYEIKSSSGPAKKLVKFCRTSDGSKWCEWVGNLISMNGKKNHSVEKFVNQLRDEGKLK